MKDNLIMLERTCYSHNDVCSEIRHNLVQKRLKHENKTLKQKANEIFDEIGIDVESIVKRVFLENQEK